MRIALAPLGTRGDVEPFLALASKLRERGHQIVFVAPERHCERIRSFGFESRGITGDFEELLGKAGEEFSLLRRIGKRARYIFDTIHEVARDSDALVGAMLQIAGPSIAEQVGIPYYYVVFCPVMLPCDELPLVGVPTERLPVALNISLRKIGEAIWNVALRGSINAERRRIGQPRVRDVYSHLVSSGTLLCAFDGKVAPLPREYCNSTSALGFWTMPNGAPLDREVDEFLQRGEKPIYVGFGSQQRSARSMKWETIRKAISRVGCRAIVNRAFDRGTEPKEESIHVVSNVPHGELFPRVAAVVHHGGAGTFASAVRSGVPQIIVPHYADQFYWAYRAQRLSVGPAPVRTTFGPERLADVIRAVLGDTQMAAAAKRLAQPLNVDAGLVRAAELLETRR